MKHNEDALCLLELHTNGQGDYEIHPAGDEHGEEVLADIPGTPEGLQFAFHLMAIWNDKKGAASVGTILDLKKEYGY